MNQSEVRYLLNRVGSVIIDSHFVYDSWKHGSVYVVKDVIYRYPIETSQLAEVLAEKFAEDDIEVVSGIAIGGAILAEWVAYHLSTILSYEVPAVFIEKEKVPIPGIKECIVSIEIDQLVYRHDYDTLVNGKRVLIVDDIVNELGLLKSAVDVTRAYGGNVIGVGAFASRAGITGRHFSRVPKQTSLLTVKFQTWDEDTCPLCEQGVPVNTDYGKGAEFVAHQKKHQ